MLAAVYEISARYPTLRRLFAPTWRMGRSACWKLRRLFWPKTSIVVSFGRGQTLQMAPDGQIAEMLWGRLFEKELRDFVSRYLKQGMRVINIGANSGLYTLMASQLVGDEGVVHAIEPSTENYARLQRNIELNQCKNVVTRRLALGDFDGVVSLRFDPKNPQLDGHFYVDKVKSGGAALNDIETVPCKTLDNYWKEAYPAGPPPVDLIVIDVEGAELEVFKGALSTFNHSPSLAIYFECTQKIEEMELLLRSSGFQFYEWDPTNLRLAAISIKRGHVLAMRDSADSLSPSM